MFKMPIIVLKAKVPGIIGMIPGMDKTGGGVINLDEKATPKNPTRLAPIRVAIPISIPKCIMINFSVFPTAPIAKQVNKALRGTLKRRAKPSAAIPDQKMSNKIVRIFVFKTHSLPVIS